MKSDNHKLPEKIHVTKRCDCAHCRNNDVIVDVLNQVIDYLKSKEDEEIEKKRRILAYLSLKNRRRRKLYELLQDSNR